MIVFACLFFVSSCSSLEDPTPTYKYIPFHYIKKQTFIQTSDDETMYVNPDLKQFSKFVFFGKSYAPKVGIGYIYISSKGEYIVTQLNKIVDLNLDLKSFKLTEHFYIGDHDEHTSICHLNYFLEGDYQFVPSTQQDFYKITRNSQFLMYVKETDH